MNILEKLDTILEKYYLNYNNIFEHLDPRLLSAKTKEEINRFNEENQTINFCNAIQQECADAVVWYEFPWRIDGIKNGNQKISSNRFDAVVYLTKNKSLLIIEAKCLRKPSKYDDMHTDLKRICGKGDFSSIQANFPEFNDVYAVILADYWKKKSGDYKDIVSSWNSKNTDKVLVDFTTDVNDYLDDAKWESSTLERFGEKYKDYYLLTLIGKIKEMPNYKNK